MSEAGPGDGSPKESQTDGSRNSNLGPSGTPREQDIELAEARAHASNRVRSRAALDRLTLSRNADPEMRSRHNRNIINNVLANATVAVEKGADDPKAIAAYENAKEELELIARKRTKRIFTDDELAEVYPSETTDRGGYSPSYQQDMRGEDPENNPQDKSIRDEHIESAEEDAERLENWGEVVELIERRTVDLEPEELAELQLIRQRVAGLIPGDETVLTPEMLAERTRLKPARLAEMEEYLPRLEEYGIYRRDEMKDPEVYERVKSEKADLAKLRSFAYPDRQGDSDGDATDATPSVPLPKPNE